MGKKECPKSQFIILGFASGWYLTFGLAHSFFCFYLIKNVLFAPITIFLFTIFFGFLKGLNLPENKGLILISLQIFFFRQWPESTYSPAAARPTKVCFLATAAEKSYTTLGHKKIIPQIAVYHPRLHLGR